MYFPHEHNAKLAAQHIKTQQATARDRLKANAAWNKANKPRKAK